MYIGILTPNDQQEVPHYENPEYRYHQLPAQSNTYMLVQSVFQINLIPVSSHNTAKAFLNLIQKLSLVDLSHLQISTCYSSGQEESSID